MSFLSSAGIQLVLGDFPEVQVLHFPILHVIEIFTVNTRSLLLRPVHNLYRHHRVKEFFDQ